MEYKNIPISLLDLSHIRDIRESVISTLEERIGTSGYNPAKPLSVIENDGRYIVADGAHRLTVITNVIYFSMQEYTCLQFCDYLHIPLPTILR